MIVIGILALLGLGLVALSGRTSINAAQATVNDAIARTAQGIASVAPVRSQSGPPGLLLRREPEIRHMNPETLATYVQQIRSWLDAGGTPDDAWWTSFVQAQAEVLLRVTRRTDGLTDVQVDALLSWLLQLEQAGMPLDTDERALLINLREEHEHRFGEGGR